MKNPGKISKIMANGYSSKSAQRDLSNEYQYDRVKMGYNILCVLVLWTKVALALEGLSREHGHVLTCGTSRRDLYRKKSPSICLHLNLTS